MRKILALLLALVLAIGVSACGHSVASVGSDAPADSETSEASEGEEVAGSEEPDEAPAEESGSFVTGTVVYYDDATLAICSTDNINLNFLVAGVEIDKSGARGLDAGSEADVYYAGQISGNNASAARVTKLVQSSGQLAAGAARRVTGGIITDADASALSILSFDGEALTFSIAGKDIDMEHTHGLTVGDYVTVFYEGGIADGNAEAVNVVKIVQ